MTLNAAGGGLGADVAEAVSAAHRDHWATVLANAARAAGGNLSIAEEATQDAFLAAVEVWPKTGIPGNPPGWLTQTAKRKVVDALRRAGALQRKLPSLHAPDEFEEEQMSTLELLDDRLRLIFTCCHPALAMNTRVALTLRMVGGLSTTEIAAACLVQETTMAARITRAKKKIAVARIPYRVPDDAELPERLDGVLAVISLIYTAGHTASASVTLQRRDLASDAVDLARMLSVLAPDEPEVLGLLALLELNDSRRLARETPEGGIVLLEDQDRGVWDRRLIASGVAALQLAYQRLGPSRQPGRFLLQAGLAAVHAQAPTFADTDWWAAVLIYDQLLVVEPSPVVALNRAVAISYRDGPGAGLVAIDVLRDDERDVLRDDERLRRYHYLPAARADLLRQLNRDPEAAREYRAALELVTNEAERQFMEQRLAGLDPS